MNTSYVKHYKYNLNTLVLIISLSINCFFFFEKAFAFAKKTSSLSKRFNLDKLMYAEDYEKRINFWKDIFLKYNDEMIVIHDRFRPWIIIDYIDFTKLAKHNNYKNGISRQDQSLITDAYLNHYQQAFDNYKTHGIKGVNYGKAEIRLYLAYQHSEQDLNWLTQGKLRIRAQRGLATTFLQAANTAQDYLPYFEKEFRSLNIPLELTRLAFVESMFDPNAISKVGASGMWQFMPTTAKLFLKVNYHLDERSSPFKAARAAGNYLKSHYKKLAHWPLAITAYNHGRAGVLRAIKTTGSEDISVIVREYNQGSFGFASQNFFAEFMAVVRSYETLVNSGRLSIKPSNLDISSVSLRSPVKIKHLEKEFDLSLEKLKKLNPCIRSSTFKRHPNYKLPKKYRLYLPRKVVIKYNQTAKSYSSL